MYIYIKKYIYIYIYRYIHRYIDLYIYIERERGEVLAALVSHGAIQAVPIRLHLCAPPQKNECAL